MTSNKFKYFKNLLKDGDWTILDTFFHDDYLYLKDHTLINRDDHIDFMKKEFGKKINVIDPQFLYEDDLDLWSKMETIAQKIYGAKNITATSAVKKQIDELQKTGYGKYPVCVAKTQYSFSTDPALRGAPSGHEISIREVRLAAGAEFIVMVCGDIMTMPGLPKVPAAEKIDLDDEGNVTGLF